MKSKFTFANPFSQKGWVVLILNSSLILISAGLILLHNNLPPEIPLWFSRSWGEGRLASPLYLWIIPGLGVFSLVLNFILISLIKKGYVILSKILIGASLLTSLFLTFSIYRILINIG